MKVWSRVLSAEERTEVEAHVVASFIDTETGATRPTVAAKAEFVARVRLAESAGKRWADLLLDEWAERGAGTFAAELWKRRDAFTTTVKGVQRTRALRRGRKQVTDDGERVDVQASLLDWSADDLKEAIVAESMRAKEARINLDTYAALLRLVSGAEAESVGEALSTVGLSLDEYLARSDEAVAS